MTTGPVDWPATGLLDVNVRVGLDGETHLAADAWARGQGSLTTAYAAQLPGLQVTPLLAGLATPADDPIALNVHASRCLDDGRWPGVVAAPSDWSSAQLERMVKGGKFAGMMPAAWGADGDDLPASHLALADANRWVLLLPACGSLPRLAERVLELESHYPHIGLIVTGLAGLDATAESIFGALRTSRRTLLDVGGDATDALLHAGLAAFGGPQGAARLVWGSGIVLKGVRVVESPTPAGQLQGLRRASQAAGLTPAEVAAICHDNAAHLILAVLPTEGADGQLHMLWPADRSIPAVSLPPAYVLREYRPADEAACVRLLQKAGFTVFDFEGVYLREYMRHILPGGFFVVEHRATGELAATAMACRNDRIPEHPHGGELGWVAGSVAHAGRGLGRAVSTAVLQHFQRLGYTRIFLRSEDWRSAALRTYLAMGWRPYIYMGGMAERWQAICVRVGLPYVPVLG